MVDCVDRAVEDETVVLGLLERCAEDDAGERNRAAAQRTVAVRCGLARLGLGAARVFCDVEADAA